MGLAIGDHGSIAACSIRDQSARPRAVEATEARVVASATAHVISIVTRATLFDMCHGARRSSSAL
jgi:hypothetical protein